MTTLIPVALSLTLVACGEPAQRALEAPLERSKCTTTCGLQAYGINESCDQLEALEADLLKTFASHWEPAKACSYLNGMSLRVAGAGDSFDYNGQTVGGVTDPSQMLIMVSGQPLRTGGQFVHELAHVFDWRDEQNPRGFQHEDWYSRGLVADMEAWHRAQAN